MERNDWHLREAESVLSELKTDMYTGLSSREAARRRRREGAGRIWYIRRTSVRETVLACLSDLATLLLVITAVFAAVFEESRSALAIVVILILGAVLRTATYCKAKRILEDNASEGVPTCSVLRDGTMQLLSAEELAVGDIVFLEGGDMVPGDGRIVAGDDLAVSERGITANRDTVQKFETVIRTEEAGSAIPAEYRSNLLYAGSTVLWGHARMVVTATGQDTLIVRKQGGIRIPAGETLPLMERLTGWCRMSSLVMLACVLVITVLALFLRHGFAQTFLTSMALAVASMSEYLTTIAYIIIAVALQDTGRRKKPSQASGPKQRKAAVIGDITSISRLAGVKRLVLSDIRLLKSGEMALHSWFTEDALHSFPKDSEPVGNAVTADGPYPALENLLRMLLATVGGVKLDTSLSGSATTAMPEKYTMLHRGADTYVKKIGRNVDFSFAALDAVDGKTGIAGGLDTVLIQEKDGIFAVVSGEIRQVMQCCSTRQGPGGKILPMDDAMRRKIFTEAAKLAFMGASVIACARRSSPYNTLNRLSLLQSNMTFMGFCAIAEPPADGVRESIGQLRQAGISLVLLSDDMERDLYYGHEIGLFDKKTVLIPQSAAAVLPESGNVIVEVPQVQSHSLAGNVGRSQVRYDRLKALFATLPGEAEAKKHKHKTPHTAVLVRSVMDARLLTLGDSAVAVGDSDTRPLPQPLKAKADVIVYPSGGHGGLSETIGSIAQSRRSLFHLWSAAVYLSGSQLSRMVLLLCAVIFGFAMPSAEVLLTAGLLLDFAAVLVLAFVKAPSDILSMPEERLGLPRGKKTYGSVLGLGLFWGALLSAIPLLCGLLKTEYMGALTAAMVLSQLFVSGSVGQRTPYFRSHFHVAYILYALLSAVLAVAVLLMQPGQWYAALLALVPPVILLAVCEIFKHAFFTPRKDKKEKRKKEEPDMPSAGEEKSEEGDKEGKKDEAEDA